MGPRIVARRRAGDLLEHPVEMKGADPAASASSARLGIASLFRNSAHALSTAATCREAGVPSVGRQRLQGRSPAASAAAVVSKNIVFLRSGSRDVQPGRQ